MARRRRGTGSIEPTRDGRFRVRGPGEKQPSLGVYSTRDEAETVLDCAVQELRDVTSGDGATLGQWGQRVLDQRERDGLRGVAEERDRWRAYVERDVLARLPVRTIDRRDVLRWLDGMLARRATKPAKKTEAVTRRRVATGRKLSRRTVGNALVLVRAVLEDAAQRNVIALNPARDVTLPRDPGRTHEPWTFLTLAEQMRIMLAAGRDWPMLGFAIGTGLRQGEQWAIRIEDVIVTGDRPRAIVRYGKRGKPTKSGRIRVVPLFGLSLEAARAQIAYLATRQRPKRRRAEPSGVGLLFPSARDEHRSPGEPAAFVHAREAAQLGRHVRWHDLRHTCASSLVGGFWGRAWSLEEVRALLGHSSIKVTERYAHLAGTLVERAADETQGRGDRSPLTAAADAAKCWSHLRDLNSRPTVYECGPVANDLAPVRGLSPRERGYRALALVAAGSPLAGRAAVEALAEVLGSAQVERYADAVGEQGG